MSMQTVLGRVFGSVRWGSGTAAVVAAVGLSGVGAVGAGTAHAQDCDPVEVEKLLASVNGTSNFRAEFGGSVSIDGDTAIIGADFQPVNETRTGAAYVFIRSEGDWIQQAKLLPVEGEENDRFGQSVSVSGDTAVIGVSNDDDSGSASGSVYVFTRSGSAWTLQAKLLADDGAAADHFGYSVSISGDTAVIGAWGNSDNGASSGSAYVFTRSGGIWTQQAKLLADQGETNDSFGVSVALIDDTAVIGASGDGDNGPASGSAYVFTRSGGVWTQQAKLLPDDGADFDLFGRAVSLSGDTVVIGADKDDDNGTASGSAYVFSRSGGVWNQQGKLLAGDGAAYDGFGYTVSLCDDTAVIGAYRDDDNDDDSGSAYVFTRSGGIWTQEAKLLPGDGDADDEFGTSVSLSGGTVVIGAPEDNVNYEAGSAYVFNLHCTDCPADLNGDGVVNTQDFLAFLGAWSTGDPLADWDGNGTINTLDFLAYLADWTAGC